MAQRYDPNKQYTEKEFLHLRDRSRLPSELAMLSYEEYLEYVGVDAEEPTGYEAMDVDALKDELRKRDLPVSGKKADLIARLEENDASEDDEDEDSENDDEDEDAEE